MMRYLSRVCMFGALLFVAACTSSYHGNVSSFHEMTVPGGERVMLMPMLEDKTDSLEFKQYADVLAGHLAMLGYKEPGKQQPELIAGFDVTITDGREKLENRPRAGHPYWRGGFWTHGFFWRTGPSPFYDPWHKNEVVAKTVYTATLIFELRKPDGEMIYEGRAELETRNKDLPAIMPYLAKVMFERFPGENGVTQKVRIEREPKTKVE